MSRLPRLQPCQVSALQIGDDLIRNTAVNVRFLGHFGFPSLCWPWVASADATLAFAENGVCKPQEENAERGINGGDPPLRGGGRLCRESPILFLRRAEGLAPKHLAASAADDERYGMEAGWRRRLFAAPCSARQPARAPSRGNALTAVSISLRLRRGGRRRF